MNYCRVCRICKQKMKKIPIKKIDSRLILEYYCPNCDESEYKYENLKDL